MCAIFGWVKKTGFLNKEEIASARKALLTMKHRGPDFQGEWLGDSVYMGHCRLKIIDLSDKANQPFFDESKNYVLAFNGEIYNYIELREQLKNEGFRFRTNSDTEVFLAAFKLWGKKAFAKLDGMFAGSIYDKFAEKLFIFRDHLGQKPLYYYDSPSELIYVSELRALLSLQEFPWKLDLDNFLKFLTNSYYIWDSSPLKGVKKLLPGCYLEVDKNTTVLNRYWDSIPRNGAPDLSFSDAVSEFERLFDHSCKICLRADVPYGIFLSGGIDSSLILDFCSRINPGISSFSVSVGESDFDEARKIKIVTDRLKVKKSKSYIFNPRALLDSMEGYFSHADEPHGDPGSIISYFLAKSSRTDIAVALAGDGADELFGGYLSFLALGQEDFFGKLPLPFMSGLNLMARKFIPASDTYMGFQFKTLSFLQGFPAHPSARFPLWLGAISPEELQRLCPWKETAFFSRSGEQGTLFADFRKVLAPLDGGTRKQALLYFYQKFFLPEFVCMHTDRAAMQNSLEVRSPYLSVPLIEFANRLPDQLKIRKSALKQILRQVLSKRGFSQEIYKQKKQGFTFPVARWLKSAIKEEMEKSLSIKDGESNRLVNPKYLSLLKEEHLLGKRNNYRILFNLMVFAKWLEKQPKIAIPF